MNEPAELDYGDTYMSETHSTPGQIKYSSLPVGGAVAAGPMSEPITWLPVGTRQLSTSCHSANVDVLIRQDE